jgi:outer membrane protein TolC
MRFSYAGYDAARLGAESATKALELATLAYRAGATSNLDVIDAERRARDAATTAVIAEDAVRQANLDLLSAAGRFP